MSLKQRNLPDYSELFPAFNQVIISKYGDFISTRLYKKKIDFEHVQRRVKNFIGMLLKKKKKIISILLKYESFEVASDEFDRTLDLLQHLEENKSFFTRQLFAVTTFLPRNQPLYALTCFAIVPSLMAAEVHVRAPLAMNFFFKDLIFAISLDKFFSNINVSFQKREEFLQSRAALITSKKTGQLIPITDVVIFTGTMENADKIRKRFDERVLFIANGAGHNPIVITETADLEKAVNAALCVQLYNQGQDCANPNSILVHKKLYNKFVELLEKNLRKVKIGDYKNIKNRVGPISERKDLSKIQEIFVENAEWLHPRAPGVIHTKTAIVEPTIILRPLKEGGNFIEAFAPVFFVQKYEKDSDLALYFEDSRYERNAMYITLFGKSSYVEKMRFKAFTNKCILHDDSTIIRDTHLHAPGIERGTQPYGGYGRGSSCVSIYGIIISKPTCPQRDIFDWLIYPSLQAEVLGRKPALGDFLFSVQPNDFYNLISAESVRFNNSPKHSAHVITKIASVSHHITQKLYHSHLGYMVKLREAPNLSYIGTMSKEACEKINQLKIILEQGSNSAQELKEKLYAAGASGHTGTEAKDGQRSFFVDIYNLLFGADQGPKLDSFLFSAKKSDILKLIQINN